MNIPQIDLSVAQSKDTFELAGFQERFPGIFLLYGISNRFLESLEPVKSHQDLKSICLQDIENGKLSMFFMSYHRTSEIVAVDRKNQLVQTANSVYHYKALSK